MLVDMNNYVCIEKHVILLNNCCVSFQTFFDKGASGTQHTITLSKMQTLQTPIWEEEFLGGGYLKVVVFSALPLKSEV